MPHNSTQFQYSPEIALGPTVKGSISQDWDTCQLQVEILVTCVSDHWLHFGGFHDLLLGFYYNNLLEQLTDLRKPIYSPDYWFITKHICCSVAQSCPTLCDPMDCSMPGLSVLHHLPELAQTHVHWVGDAIQSSHPLLSPTPALKLSQHQGLSQRVGCSHQEVKILELQLQHQLFQWIFRTDFL